MSPFIAKLDHLGIVEVSGADAHTFVSAQFTSQANLLSNNQAQYSAWCNAKGQVIANFFLVKLAQKYLLVLPAVLADQISRRLQMFVLRSRVIINYRGPQALCLGVAGESAVRQLAQLSNAPVPEINHVHEAGEMVMLGIQNSSCPRVLVIADGQSPASIVTELEKTIMPVDPACWRLADIHAGLPWIGNETSGKMLPQELNLDLLGGLSYDKGCYPGQEIIARVYFRHRLKQRLYMAITDKGIPPLPGTPLFTPGEEQTVGMIINSEPGQDNKVAVLAVIKTEFAPDREIHVNSSNGPRLAISTLPYS